MENRAYLGAIQKYDELGFGSSATVYLCDYFDSCFAYKEIFGEERRKFCTDKIMRATEFSSDCDYIFPLVGIFKRPSDNYLVGYVMDYLYKYQGLDTLENIGIGKKLEILTKARALIEKLHEKYNCLHGDICPWNFQYNVSNDDLKLIDFDTNIDLKKLDIKDDRFYNVYANEYLNKIGVDKNLDIFLFNLMVFGMFNNVSFNSTLEWIRKGNFGIFDSNENIKKVFESYKDLECKNALKKEYVIDYL